MLATLNLQLSPVELLDDSSRSPLATLPGEMNELAAGFADLLRLRVDESMRSDFAGGELLPQGGSELPVTAQLLATGDDVRAAPFTLVGSELIEQDVAPAPAAESEIGLQAESPDLLLDSPVLYPAPAPAPAPEIANRPHPLLAVNAPASIELPPIPAGNPGTPQLRTEGSQGTVAVDSRNEAYQRLGPRPASSVVAPPIEGSEARARNLATEVAAPSPASLGLRERSMTGESALRAVRPPIPDSDANVEYRPTPAGVSARPVTMPLQGVGLRVEQDIDSLPAKHTLAKASQVVQGPISPQPAQSALPPAPASAADPGYASLTQQSTDLIGIPVRDPAWREQIGDRVIMMAGSQLKQAEIRLTPAELGPLRVQVSVDDGAAHVTFHAQHAVTREALEQAMPRLREMLAENGLSLGQADVAEHGVGEGHRDHGSDDGVSRQAGDEAGDSTIDIAADAPRPRGSSNGLVDTFA